MLNDEQQASLALWYVVNTSLTSYHKLTAHFGSAQLALQASRGDWNALSLHKSHLARFEDKSSIHAFVHTICDNVGKGVYHLLFDLPDSLKNIYDPPPFLFYKGDITKLFRPTLAVVGTRHPTEYGQKISFDLAQYLVQHNFVIVSGLAQGVDSCAHRGALAQHNEALFGLTVGVMGTGIDVCYPKNHQGLFFDIVQAGGCLVSELLPGTPATQHNFPRRNRIVVGLAQATIVTEATLPSGSLLSARLTAEQGKQVFVVPNRIDSPASEGCHHLIREGATLIYHPMQIVEELSVTHIQPYSPINQASIFAHHTADTVLKTEKSPKSQEFNQPMSVITPTVPAHLLGVFDLLDMPKDLDKLVRESGASVPELLVKLTELELLGVVAQQGGVYVKLQ